MTYKTNCKINVFVIRNKIQIFYSKVLTLDWNDTSFLKFNLFRSKCKNSSYISYSTTTSILKCLDIPFLQCLIKVALFSPKNISPSKFFALQKVSLDQCWRLSYSSFHSLACYAHLIDLALKIGFSQINNNWFFTRK